jgi:glycerol-3-phosphate dehydrogenase
VLDAGDGVVTVTGGKWTTYRQMAEDAVDALRPYLGPLARTRTAHLALHGTGAWRPSTPLETHLYRRYGQDSAAVLALIDADPSLGELAVPGQEYVRAELVYAAREEMATSLVDLLTRRTRAHLHDARATRDAAASLAALVAPTLGWDDAETSRQVAAYHDLVTRELTSAGLDPS